MSLYTPNKVLPFTVVSSVTKDSWPYDDGTGDPYWAGGSTPRPYRWEYELTISETYHSSHLTATAKKYTGMDIFAGFWIADSYGNALKIIQVISKTPSSIRVLVEDVDRYNTFQDPSQTGVGSLQTTTGVVFELDDEGMPKLDPLPSNVNVSFIPKLYGRFQRFDPQSRFRFVQENHGFKENDVLVINPSTGKWEKFSAANEHLYPIGTVADEYPYPNTFFLRPFNTIVEDILPALPGNVGDFVYADPTNPGKLTNVAGANARRVYIKLTDSVPSSVQGSVAGATVNVGDVLRLNGVNVTFTGATIDNVVFNINNTAGHFVTASKQASPTVATTDSAQLAYGIVGAIQPVSASINGVTVNFTTDKSGSVAFGMPGASDHNDMAEDINAANIPNITASVNSGKLVITNTAGGQIEIVNIVLDGSGYGWAGPSSCTGVPLSTVASTDSYLKLVRNDGGPITVSNGTGNPVEALGIFSVDNGRLPVGMQVESAATAGITGGGTSEETKVEFFTPVVDQTTFTLTSDATSILAFAINGIETRAFAFTAPRTIVFDPVVAGYGLDSSDEVMVTFKG